LVSWEETEKGSWGKIKAEEVRYDGSCIHTGVYQGEKRKGSKSTIVFIKGEKRCYFDKRGKRQ